MTDNDEDVTLFEMYPGSTLLGIVETEVFVGWQKSTQHVLCLCGVPDSTIYKAVWG